MTIGDSTRALRQLTAWALMVLAGLTDARAAAPAPRLEIEAAAELGAARARLDAFDTQRLAEIVTLVGLADPGPPIRVVLASERSHWARKVTPWTAGLALGLDGVVILFPARSPGYPHDTLEDVMRHEVAHVLIARAAGGRPVPRWFHEGLAMSVERPWGLEDSTRLVFELAFGPRTSLAEIGHLFSGDRGSQTRAYTLAGAFVRDLLSEHGASAPGGMLRRAGAGLPFEAAFADVTGVTLSEAEAQFWRRQRVWTVWVPFVTSTTALWMVVTLLALYAIRRRRLKSAALRRRWALEDEADGGRDQA